MSERDLSTLLDLVERHLGAEWLEVVRNLREQNKLDEIAARVEARDFEGAIQGVEDAGKAFAIAKEQAYREVGTQQAAWLDDRVSDALIRFDMSNPGAEAWAKQNRIDKIREVTQEQRDTIRQVLSDGIARGANPLEVARDIQDTIGLTEHQARIVASYRRALETQDWEDALGRELSDGRHDRTIRRVQRDRGKLTQAQIDKMVDRYAENWRQHRAETIARTEGLRTLHEASEESLRQAIDGGHVEADSIVREWNHAGVGLHSRPGHRELDGEQRKVGEAWTNPVTGATLRYPGDPSAGPAETVNCRCNVSTRMVA